MFKKDLNKTFIDERYSKPPKKNCPTNKTVYNNIDEIRSFDLADFSDYKISNKKGYRNIFVIFDIFSEYTWCLPVKKNSQIVTNEFSNILTTPKRKPLKIESERSTEFYICIFQNFMRSKNEHQ